MQDYPPQQPAYGTPAYGAAPAGYPVGPGPYPQGTGTHYAPGKVSQGNRRFGSMSILAIVLFIGGIFLPVLWFIAALLPCCVPADHPERRFVSRMAMGAAIALFVYLVIFAILFGVGWTNWRSNGVTQCPCSRNDLQCRNYYNC